MVTYGHEPDKTGAVRKKSDSPCSFPTIRPFIWVFVGKKNSAFLNIFYIFRLSKKYKIFFLDSPFLAVPFRSLLQGCQSSIEQGIGKGHVMDAFALVFFDEEVVPEGGCLSFGVIADNYDAVFI